MNEGFFGGVGGLEKGLEVGLETVFVILLGFERFFGELRMRIGY